MLIVALSLWNFEDSSENASVSNVNKERSNSTDNRVVPGSVEVVKIHYCPISISRLNEFLA